MPIRFFHEDINFKVSNPRKTKLWIESSAKNENKEIDEVSYIFCSDAYLLELNQKFLHHNTLTDIITFDYSEDTRLLKGEIYISIDRVTENSIKYKNKMDEELLRVIIHGVLHLCGYKDKTQSEITLMRKKEDTYISLWKKSFHVKR